MVTVLGKVTSNSNEEIMITDSTGPLKINFTDFAEQFEVS